MPINHDMMHAQSHDEVAALKARIAELERMDTEHTVQIAKMNAYIRELEDAQRWRKCSEELPELEGDYGETFLVCVEQETETSPKGNYVMEAELCEGEWYNPTNGNKIEENVTFENGFYKSKVTHWMPLPKEPAAE